MVEKLELCLKSKEDSKMLFRLKVLIGRLPILARRIWQMVKECLEIDSYFDHDERSCQMRHIIAHLKWRGNLITQTFYRFPNHWGAIISQRAYGSAPTELIVIQFPDELNAWFIFGEERSYHYDHKKIGELLEILRKRPQSIVENFGLTPMAERLYPTKWFQMVFDHLCYRSLEVQMSWSGKTD